MSLPCNPQSAKAGNPLYRCNDLTGRWVKVTNVNRRRTAVAPVEEPVAPITPITPATPVTPVTPVAPVTPATPATPVAPIVQRVNQGQRRPQQQQRQQMIRQLYSGMQSVLSSLSSPEELTKALRKLSVSQRRLLALRSEIQGARDMTDDQIFQQLRTRYTPSPVTPVVTPVVAPVVQQQQRRQVEETVTPPVNGPPADVNNDEGFHVRPNFEIMALYQLQHYAREYNIRGRSGMTKPELIRALTEHFDRYIPLPSFVPPPVRTPPVRTPVIEQQQTQDIQQQTQDIQIQQIPQQQQWWKTRCNNDDGTLQSQEWKDVSRKDVIRFQGYCFTLSEIYSLLHRAFTSVDTSYGIPPLRLQIPSEPFGRIPFRLPFFLELRKKATEDNLPIYPEVMYFLRNVRKFYAEDGPVHRFLSQIDPHKAQVSASIEKFLLNKNKLQMVRTGQRANTEISWKFNNVISSQLTTPSSKLKYIQGKHW